MPAASPGCPCRKQDDEQGRLIDQVTSETSVMVEGLRMKQQSMKQKEGQAQQLRGQVTINPLKLECTGMSVLPGLFPIVAACRQMLASCCQRRLPMGTASDMLAAWLISNIACCWSISLKCCLACLVVRLSPTKLGYMANADAYASLSLRSGPPSNQNMYRMMC